MSGYEDILYCLKDKAQKFACKLLLLKGKLH